MKTDEEAGCVCWRIPDENGKELSAAWTFAHDRVRVTKTSGERIVGWSEGPSCCQPEDHFTEPRPVVVMSIGGGMFHVVEGDEIATVEPLEGISTEWSALQAFLRLWHEASEEVSSFHAITDDHRTLTIAVKETVRACRPYKETPG